MTHAVKENETFLCPKCNGISTLRPNEIEHGGVKISFDEHKLYVNGEARDATTHELEMLHFLITNRGRVVSRADILAVVWGRDVHVMPRTVDAHFVSLRRLIKGSLIVIETVYGVGYRLTSMEAKPSPARGGMELPDF